MTDPIIYLDNNASTPCDPRVVEAMLPYLTETYANPSSRNHRPGREASTALETARSGVARRLGARSAAEIVWTSGASEGNNHAISAFAEMLHDRRRHVITQATEHPSVLEPLRRLSRRGWEVREIGVDRTGRTRLNELREALRDDTALVCLMLANNETGVIQPVAEAAEMARERGALVHCDAAQAVGKIPLDLATLEVDSLTISGHKIYAPKGIGALYLRRQRPALKIEPLISGGGHEYGLRSGTPNVAGAVALARALEIAENDLETEARRLAALRDRLEATLTGSLDGATINGSLEHRLPGTTNISFAGVEGNALLASLPDLAVSSGSACTSTHSDASPVLLAMSVPKALARASLRFGLGRFTTEGEIDRAARRIVDEVIRLRSISRR